MNKALVGMLIGLPVIFISSSAHAGTTTAPLNLSATVEAHCTASTTSLDFGFYDPSWIVQNAGSITVNCTAGAPYLIALDAGMNYGPSEYGDDCRHVSNGIDKIGYVLQTGPNFWDPYWGDNLTYPYGPPVGGTGTGADQVHVVHGTLWPLDFSDPSAGHYLDHVGVTVHY